MSSPLTPRRLSSYVSPTVFFPQSAQELTTQYSSLRPVRAQYKQLVLAKLNVSFANFSSRQTRFYLTT